MSYFPMFIELNNQDCLVVGGGRVALRKVKVLRDFGAAVTVLAPEILPDIQQFKDVTLIQREFTPEDVLGRRLVVAAVGKKEINRNISRVCREKGIPVNAVDQQEDCSFIFPAYLREGEVVAAFSSGGQSPVITQYLKEYNRPVVTEFLGEVAQCLGSLRDAVKRQVGTEEDRKKVYQEILARALETGEIPTEQQIVEEIKKVE